MQLGVKLVGFADYLGMLATARSETIPINLVNRELQTVVNTMENLKLKLAREKTEELLRTIRRKLKLIMFPVQSNTFTLN